MQFLMFWPDYPKLVIAFWVVVAVVAMYLTKRASHRAIYRASRAGYRWLRLAARGSLALAQRLDVRNREVMLALQTEISRRQLERELQRVAAAVEEDMTKFQHLERGIHEHLAVLAEDFERSTQVPPAAPGWVAAVDAIAKLEAESNPEAVARILQDIHVSVQDQQREAMREWRWAVTARHKILADLRPLWRRVDRQVGAMGRDSRELLQRAHRIDTQMAAFRELCANRADVRADSFIARWVVALGLTATAAMLVVLNIDLLALPLSALLSGQRPADFSLVELTAAAYTCAIVAAAVLVAESTKITRMLPLIGGLPRQSRIGLTLLACLLLAALVGGQAAMLAHAATTPLPGWPEPLPSWAVAGIGLIIPLLMALLSPAVETLLATTRPVLVSLLIGLLGVSGLLLRLFGRMWIELGQLCHHLYDIIIFVPMALERAWLRRQGRVPEVAATPPRNEVTVVRRLQFDRKRANGGEPR